MAILNGTVWSVSSVDGMSGSGGLTAAKDLQAVKILFTISGTYAQADDAKLLNLATLIGASRRDGKTITLRHVGPCQAATKASDPSAILGLTGVSLSTNDAAFTITDGDWSTEHADATAVPAQDRPFGIMVFFTAV